MLVQRVEETAAGNGDPLSYQGRRVVPLVTPALDNVSQPYVYFIVYPDKSRAEKPQWRKSSVPVKLLEGKTGHEAGSFAPN